MVIMALSEIVTENSVLWCAIPNQTPPSPPRPPSSSPLPLSRKKQNVEGKKIQKKRKITI